MSESIFLVLVLIAVMLAFIAYVIAISAAEKTDDDLIHKYLLGLRYSLTISGWILAITFPLVGVWLIIHFALGIFGS